MSDERTNFEQRLADLTPASSIDRGCVMFAAGQASVSADQVASERFWKRWAVSSSVTSLLLVATLAALATSRGFEGSPNLADQSRDANVRLDATARSDDRPFSGAIQQASNGDVNRARQLPNSEAERAPTAHVAEMVSQVSPASQFELRRIALAERQEAVPERSRKMV